MILVIISALAILAVIFIISPDSFRVLVSPEFVALLARVGSIPKDLTRIIDGLVHIPVDTMKAIIVLDASASVKG